MKEDLKDLLLPAIVLIVLSTLVIGAFAWAINTNGGSQKNYSVSGDIRITGTAAGGPAVDVTNIKVSESWFPFTVTPMKETCILTACGGTNIILTLDGHVVNYGSWSTGPLGEWTIVKQFSVNGVTAGNKTINVQVLGDSSEIVAEKNIPVVIK